MRASRPTDARKAAAVPVWPETQILFVGAGFIPPAGVRAAAGCGGMGASRPTAARWVAVVRFRGSFRKVCRGGIYCARRRVSEANRRTAAALRPEIPPGALRRRRVPGTMQASSPTEVCYNAGPRFLGWPRHSPSSVGADSISARGLAATQGSRDDLRPKSRACGPVGLRNAPAGAVQASSPTGGCVMRGRSIPVGRRIRRRPQGPAPQKQNTTNVPPCRIPIAAARPRTAS